MTDEALHYVERIDKISDRIAWARENVLPDAPPIYLPGSEDYWSAYRYGEELEKIFRGQAAYDLCSAVEYNWAPPQWRECGIANLVCTQHGEGDGPGWIWEVQFGDLSRWIAEGWCDYTGWDCQSGIEWTQV